MTYWVALGDSSARRARHATLEDGHIKWNPNDINS